jgi:DNA-binding NtrC family response regulator
MSYAPNQPRSTPQSPPGVESSEEKKTILIYSPDLNFCFSLSMLFQDRYNVITTTNIGMLDKLVADHSANLVMVDAVPTEKLIERLESLKGLNQHLPIILLYVYSSKDMAMDKVIRAHVDSVFYKPFEIAPVSKRIEELLAAIS